ncbi:MAG: pyridoxamine 5'-phosphate oxidase family protein [Rickettsiales bacterium]|jgi:general stress protein 26|nr:pyridoxamine 5'-phosphate oxidase family protein [Rickettsiales bacterium]
MTKSEILKFFDAQPTMSLTTMNGAVPETRAMNNIRNPKMARHLKKYFRDNDRILISTNTSSDKVAQIRKNPAANIYVFDKNFNGLLLNGKIREVTDDETRNALWTFSWNMFYPGGRDGGDYTVLEFIPETYKSYRGFGFVKTNGKIKQ